MKKVLSVLVACACLCLAGGPAAAAGVFGDAGDYNVFVTGDATMLSPDAALENGSTMGSVAVGGDATITGYHVANALSGTDAKLVVEGNLDFNNGQVGQNGTGVIYASSATLVGVTPSASEIFSPAVMDFDSAAARLEATSLAWSTMASTGGTIETTLWNTTTLTGTDQQLNVFSLDGAILSATQSLVVNAPTGLTVLINVSGDDVDFLNSNTLNGAGSNNVLYNFFEATVLDIAGLSVYGSVLAPFAVVDFDNGQLFGQLMAGALGSAGDASSGVAFNDVPFQSDVLLAPVPIPGAIWMLGGGMLGIVLSRRKKNA